MLKADVLARFKTQTAIAAALGITVQAVSQWGEVVPETSALRLEKLTRSQLRMDAALYPRRSSLKHVSLVHSS